MMIIRISVVLGVLCILGCEEPSDELTAKVYTPESLAQEICVQPKACADLGAEVYFLDHGFIFSYDKATWRKVYRKFPRVTEVLAYKGMPVLLNSTGYIYILSKTTDGQSGWADIGNNSLTIEVAGDDLLALTKKNGEVWRYQGRPGPIDWSFLVSMIPIQSSCGSNCSVTTYVPLVIPYADGRKVAFSRTVYSGVVALQRTQEGQLILKAASGRESFYQP